MQVSILKKENDKMNLIQRIRIILIRLLKHINIEKKMTKNIPAEFL